jgi:hypothetical protein
MGSGAVRRIVIGRSASALLIALAAALAAYLLPAAALFILGALAARVVVAGDIPRIDWYKLAGPALACVIVAAFVGLPGAIGVAFTWRLFSDTQWSVGEARRLAMAAGRPDQCTFTALAHAWTTPLYGLAVVAYTSPHVIAGLPLDLPHVPSVIPLAAGFIAIALVFDWMLRRAADWRLGTVAAAPAAHLAAHHVLFVLAFGAMLDISAGLVALIAWRLAHAAPFARTQPSFTAVP